MTAKTYIAIADEDGASVFTSMEGTTCPRCGTPVEARKAHLCGDQEHAIDNPLDLLPPPPGRTC